MTDWCEIYRGSEVKPKKKSVLNTLPIHFPPFFTILVTEGTDDLLLQF